MQAETTQDSLLAALGKLSLFSDELSTAKQSTPLCTHMRRAPALVCNANGIYTTDAQ
jgi:hypothetical protein